MSKRAKAGPTDRRGAADARRGADVRRGADGRRTGARPPPPGARAPEPKIESEIVYGLRAGLAVLAARPEDVLRMAASARVLDEAGSELGAFEERGVPTAELSDHELANLAGSPHHEGLVVATRPRAWASPRQLAEVLVATRGVAIALDRVRNPYNIGAILRSAAFFGVDAVLLGALAPTPDLTGNTVRVAEGGAEKVILCRTPDLGETLSRLKSRGIRIVGSDAHADKSAIGYAFARPSVLVVGHEREGMTERVRAQCDDLIAIPGSGAVDSLNVSVASGVLISELMRAAAKNPAS